MKNSIPFSLLLAASAFAISACTHREAEDVPPSASAQADFEKQAAERRAELAKGDAAAKADFEKQAADRRAELAQADAKAKADAAKADEDAAKAKAEADRMAAEAARVAAENEARAKAEADRVAAEAAPKPEPVVAVVAAPVEKPAEPVKAPVDVATAAKSAVAALVIPEAYSGSTRTIVQVDRARAATDVKFDKRAVTDAVIAGVESDGRFLSSDTLNASNGNHRSRAIYLAFDKEASALGLVPSRKLTDAPALIVDTTVAGTGAVATAVTVTAIDADTGKVVASRTQSL